MVGSCVIIEGVDGGGKTTLAEGLQQTFNAHVLHVGPPQPDSSPLCEHLNYLRMVDWYSHTVFDRFHLGGWAYGKEFRHRFDATAKMGDWLPDDWTYLEEALEDRAVLVLCDPGMDRITEEWKARRGTERAYPEYEASLNRLEIVRRHFQDAYAYSALPKTIYNYQEEGAWDRLMGWLSTSLEWSPHS